MDQQNTMSLLFYQVKYCVSGDVDETVENLLKNGGAERMNYFSDYVTHLICGANAEENDITDANDLYEIPAVITKWVTICVRLNKLVSTKPYLHNNQKLFSQMIFTLSSKLIDNRDDLHVIWALITYHGGLVQLNFDQNCTHLVTIDTSSTKYEKATLTGRVIVTPDWIIESIRNNTLLQSDLFHPKLIEWPKITKHESTTAITGFEPEHVDDQQSSNDNKDVAVETHDVPDSTQALLDRLKQRMSWNQPQQVATTQQQPTAQAHVQQQHQQGSGETVAPPNVVAPSYLNKNQPDQQQRVFNQEQQVSRNVVHPQSSLQQQQQQQSPTLQQQQQTAGAVFNQPNQLNRILGQQQPRSANQQLRGPLNPNQQQQQINQQLLQQQRINQQQQRGQLTMQQQQQQQLLQQQIAKNQLGQQQARQLLQNQVIGQQQQQVGPNQQQQQLLSQQLAAATAPIGQPQLASPQQVAAVPSMIQTQQLTQNLQQISHAHQQQQQQFNIVQQQQQSQQQHMISQQQTQHLQQQQQLNKVFNPQQNLSIQPQQQQQFVVAQQQQQFSPQNQSQQQQPHFPVVSNQPDLSQQLGLNQQFPQQQQQQQQLLLNQQQPLLNQQQPLFNQQQQVINQQPQGQVQARAPHLWQQQQPNQQQQPQQMTIRHPINIVQQQQQQQQSPRIQWSPNQQQQQQQNPLPQRQFIQLDAQTHNQLQKMPPEQQALFVARLQKQRQFLMQKHQQQQRAGGGSHVLHIRGSVPPGLNPQQQMQWLQQQAKQQGVVLPPNIQQQTISPGTLTQQQQPLTAVQHQQSTPGLSPIQQQQTTQQFNVEQQQNQQQQLQLRQYRLQQLQLQREQAQKNQLNQLALQQQQQQQGSNSNNNVLRSMTPALLGSPAPVVADSTTNLGLQEGGNISQQQQQHSLVVNAKTKTALANMLNIRLQSGATNVIGTGGQDSLPEPSAAGTLRLMTAQHNASLNSQNRTQDLMALQQQQQQQQQQRQRLINGPNNDNIIRTSSLPQQQQPSIVSAVTSQNEPPKLQYAPRNAAAINTNTIVPGGGNTIPIQHRPGPFYGHNPNLKLPPDLFLLGCIFVVVEIETYLDESLPNWQQTIEKHGGEIEKQYCNKITHVLCETQRHGVVMQAVRDCKRCVTIYWLSDIMKRKQVLPPWTALHLPTIYLDTTPASKHLIAQTGFTGTERLRIKHMINYTGAKYTSYYSKHNTLLIAARAEGPKYTHSKKWGIPIVNVQWLTDIMLGNFTALNQMDHIMYQQFPSPPNFSFDPKLLPNLMHGWKMPINISQESYERVKRSASTTGGNVPKKVKKIKTEHNPTTTTTDENDNNEFIDSNCGYRVMFSMCRDVESLKTIVRQLGGVFTKNHQDCTHLVMPSLSRTNKLLFSICRGVHIMPEQWLRDSQIANKFLDEINYTLDAKEFNREFGCDFKQTLALRNRGLLLDGKFFWVTPSVFPSRTVLVEMIQLCGGVVEKIRRTAMQIEATNMNVPSSYVIITHENDIHLVADLLKINKKDSKVRVICSAELIFSAILRQTFDVEPFAVKVL